MLRGPDVISSTGRWLCLAGLLLMISGDGPALTAGLSRLPASLPFIGSPPLYLALLFTGFVLFLGSVGITRGSIPGVPRVSLPLALLLGAFVGSAALSDHAKLSARSVLAIVCICAAGWAFLQLTRDEHFRSAAGPVVAVAVLMLDVLVISWRYRQGLTTEAFHLSNNAWLGKLQLTWVFNLFAPLLLGWAIGTPRRGVAAFYAAAWLVTGAAMYLLYSRMGVIVFGMTTAGVLIFTLSHWRRTLGIVIVASLVGVIVVGRTKERAQYVVSTIANPSLNLGVGMRLAIWTDTMRLFRARPITGHGPGTYDVVAYTLTENAPDHEDLYRGAGWHAHNVYLHLLAETGILGFAAWSYLWFTILVQLLRSWRAAAPGDRAMLAGPLWALAAFLVLSLTEVMIAARVHAAFRMNLTLAFLVAWALSECGRATPLQNT
jgi:O-antigen ligase